MSLASRLWHQVSDQLTPRASASGQHERNPFDTIQDPSVPRTNNTNAAKNNADLATPGPRPSHSSGGPPAHLFLGAGNAGAGTTTAGTVTPTDDIPIITHDQHGQGGNGATQGSASASAPGFNFTMTPSSKMRNAKKDGEAASSGVKPPPSTPTVAVESSRNGHAQVSTSATKGGNGNLQAGTMSKTHNRAASGSSSTGGLRGRVHLTIVEARNLSPPSAAARPYVVVTSDQSEFVSREPVVEREDGTQAHVEGAVKTALVGDEQGHKESASGANTATVVKENGESVAARAGGEEKSAPDPVAQKGAAYHPKWRHDVIFDSTGDDAEITACVYDRGESEEVFMGFTTLRTRLSPNVNIDDWFKLTPRADEHVSGEIRLQLKYERIEHAKRSLQVTDFDFLRLIGRGTFGRVFQVRKRDTKRIYAMKVLSKRDIVAKKEVAHTIGERKILQKSSECPFLLGLKFSFQTEKDLFLVMDYKGGGELFHHLQREGRFTEDRAKFYAAEITLAFEHLHKYDIVYRDLKPENILLDAEGHVVLCDFGLSKPDLPSDALTNTFCGTTEYLAPEVLLDDQGYTKTIDFWSLGVLLYELIAGWSPFYSEDTQQMYKNICFGKIRFPRGVMSDPGKQFVKGLLNRNPKHRLGAERGVVELKEHAFFESIDWDLLMKRQITPPFKPFLESEESTHNFDKAFTDVNIWDEAPDEVAEAAMGAFDDFDKDNQSDDDDEDRSAAWLDEAARAAWEEGRTGTGRAYSTVEPGNFPKLGDEPQYADSSLNKPKPPAQPSRGPSEDGGPGARGADVRQGANGKTKTAPKPIRTRKKSDGEPLTSSIQEHFRGFSFHGETLEGEGFATRYGKRDDAPLEEAERQFDDGI